MLKVSVKRTHDNLLGLGTSEETGGASLFMGERPMKRMKPYSGDVCNNSTTNTIINGNNNNIVNNNDNNNNQRVIKRNSTKYSDFFEISSSSEEDLQVEQAVNILAAARHRKTQIVPQRLYSGHDVRKIVIETVKVLLLEKEKYLLCEFEKILQKKLCEQFQAFSKFNQDSVSKQLKESTYDYMS